MISVIHAHPYLSTSRANTALVAALRARPDTDVRSLYDLYPDFDIDVATEQHAIAGANLIVWMHPVFWYSVPSLLKHWFDKVLAYGWAYGEGGDALVGKHCLWVPTTGGEEDTYAHGAKHANPFGSYAPAIEQTARFCGMHWERPFIVHGANLLDDASLADHVARLTERLAACRAAAPVNRAEATS